MTRREKLREEYEDALFSMLMYEIAEREGGQLLEENERLLADPGSAVPERVHRRCMKAIRSSYRREKGRRLLRFTGRALNAAGCILLVVTVLFGSAYAAFPDLRVVTLNLLIETSNVATKLTMVTAEEDGGDDTGGGDAGGSDGGAEPGPAPRSMAGGTIFGYKLPTIPEGYERTHEEIIDDECGTVVYEKDAEHRIVISVTKQSDSGSVVDSEDAVKGAPTYINGYEALIFKKENRIRIVVIDTERGYFVSLICEGIDEVTATNMALEMVS